MKARRASSLVLSFIGVRFSLLFSARGGATAFLIIDWFCIREAEVCEPSELEKQTPFLPCFPALFQETYLQALPWGKVFSSLCRLLRFVVR